MKILSQLDILLVALTMEGYSACCLLNIANRQHYDDGIIFKAHFL